jgi:hypothetical protein
VETRYTWGFALRVLLKAALLFALVNAAFILLDPIPTIGRASVYNWLAPGRERLPYGTDAAACQITLDSLDALFASHAVSAPKRADEFRLILIGDSSTWGIQLLPDDTAAAFINAADIDAGGRTVRAYNLGYPTMSALKDLLILDRALAYQPDAIIWLITLESLARSEQLTAPLLARNPASAKALLDRYALDYDAASLTPPSLWDRTLIGGRRALADWWRLQACAFHWGATGVDHAVGEYTPRSNDLAADSTWKGFTPETLTADALAFDVLAAGIDAAGSVPLLLVNEPIFIADGANSDLRYNAWYPIWAYDAYREWLQAESERRGWRLLDLWDALAGARFTDSPVHRDPEGERQVAALLSEALPVSGKIPEGTQ